MPLIDATRELLNYEFACYKHFMIMTKCYNLQYINVVWLCHWVQAIQLYIDFSVRCLYILIGQSITWVHCLLYITHIFEDFFWNVDLLYILVNYRVFQYELHESSLPHFNIFFSKLFLHWTNKFPDVQQYYRLISLPANISKNAEQNKPMQLLLEHPLFIYQCSRHWQLAAYNTYNKHNCIRKRSHIK